jgi:hypothetical protein
VNNINYDDIEHLVRKGGFSPDCIVAAAEVKTAVSRLKRDKGDVNDSTTRCHPIT